MVFFQGMVQIKKYIYVSFLEGLMDPSLTFFDDRKIELGRIKLVLK